MNEGYVFCFLHEIGAIQLSDCGFIDVAGNPLSGWLIVGRVIGDASGTFRGLFILCSTSRDKFISGVVIS